MITLIAPLLFMGAKGKLQNQQKHEQDNSREDGAPLCFPDRRVNLNQKAEL